MSGHPNGTDPSIYVERLKQIKQETALHHYTPAINQYGTLTELALERLYKDVWAHLRPDEMLKLVTAIRSFTDKNPIEAFYLGKWIDLYQRTGLPKILSRTHGLDPSAFNFDNLFAINEIRTKCTHEEYRASADEMRLVEDVVDRFLLDLKLVSTIPSIFPPDNFSDENLSRVHDLTRRIRMVLSADPIITYNEDVDEDPGLVYHIEANWEFIGAYSDDTFNGLKILIIEHHSTVHPDVSEQAYGYLENEIKQRLAQTIDEAKRNKVPATLEVNVGETPWQDYGSMIFAIEV